MNRFTVLTACDAFLSLSPRIGGRPVGPARSPGGGGAGSGCPCRSGHIAGGHGRKDEIAKLQADLAPANQRIKNRKAAQGGSDFAPLPALRPRGPPPQRS